MKTRKQLRLENHLYRLILADRYAWSGTPSKSPRFAKQKQLVEQLHRLTKFQKTRAAEKLPTFQAGELDYTDFIRETAGYTRPVVIREFAKQAVDAGMWRRERLCQRLRDRTCAVVAFDEASRMAAWDTGVDFVKMDFESFVARMASEDIYLNNSTELVEACPQLIDDLRLSSLHQFLRPRSRWDELLTTNFFIGSSRVRSSIHAAFGGNFFLNLAGRKRWRFIAPEHSALLHPVTARPFQYVRSACGGFYRSEQNNAATNIFTRLPHYEVILEPGDLLYNAPWWWHEVDNLDDFTVGCAVRHFPTPFRRSPSWANHRLFTLASTYPTSRALMFGHFFLQQLSGTKQPLRTFANKLMVRRLYKSFSRKQA